MPFRAIDVPPHWRILAPDVPVDTPTPLERQSVIRLESGRGFGTGSHETTQLCLLALSHWLRTGAKPQRVLDFGAGSGILSIGAALAGAKVLAIEIDEQAIEHARRNVALNGVGAWIEFRTRLSDDDGPFDWVLANVLRQVLLDFAEPLCSRLAPKGKLILSGLFGTDVPAILSRYRALLPTMNCDVFERGDWRAVTFQATG
jgi:ribosomal protein L11 methyltransferase